MDPSKWLLLGGLGSILVMCWRYVVAFVQAIRTSVVVSVQLDGNLPTMLMRYLQDSCQRCAAGPNIYWAWSEYVRPRRRHQYIGVRPLIGTWSLFRVGWRFLLIYNTPNEKDKSSQCRLCYLRGTFNMDDLVYAAIELANRSVHESGRHRVVYVHGTAGCEIMASDKPREAALCESSCGTSGSISLSPLYSMHVVGWDRAEISQAEGAIKGRRSLDNMALTPELLHDVKDLENWLAAKEWYQGRSIPWRRGWLLAGPPGGGKTSLIRAIAEDYDLPVFVYDLSTLRNSELRQAWQKMLACTPCIAVFEDIDAVFSGRTPLSGEVTFDCFLGCLDGVTRADGVITMITTNRPETLDEALCQQNENGMTSRPGRIDLFLTLGPLDADGREKIARRILVDWPDLWQQACDEGDGDTGAQFQERCVQLALARMAKAVPTTRELVQI